MYDSCSIFKEKVFNIYCTETMIHAVLYTNRFEVAISCGMHVTQAPASMARRKSAIACLLPPGMP